MYVRAPGPPRSERLFAPPEVGGELFLHSQARPRWTTGQAKQSKAKHGWGFNYRLPLGTQWSSATQFLTLLCKKYSNTGERLLLFPHSEHAMTASPKFKKKNFASFSSATVRRRGIYVIKTTHVARCTGMADPILEYEEDDHIRIPKS